MRIIRPIDMKALVLNSKDNVATAIKELGENTDVSVKIGEEWKEIRVKQPIPFNHKFAFKRILKGQEIIKFGECIGRATSDIEEGEHVHIHNVEAYDEAFDEGEDIGGIVMGSFESEKKLKVDNLLKILDECKPVDLSWTYYSGMTQIPVLPPPRISWWKKYPDFPIREWEEPSGFKVEKIEMATHCGTHVDAPSHCCKGYDDEVTCEGQWDIDEIPLEHLFGRAVIIDFSNIEKLHKVTKEETVNWEKTYNIRIREKDIVVFHFGWDKYFGDQSIFIKDYPSLSVEVAKYLIKRGVYGVGVDTPDIDGPGNEPLAHRSLFENNIYVIENLANLKDYANNTHFIIVSPIKIRPDMQRRGGAGGAPARVFMFA
jgi:kynurenine formamidase